MAELCAYLLREWENEDPRVLEAGVENLEEILDGYDLSAETTERSWSLPSLSDADVAALDRPNRAIDQTLNVGLAYASRHSVDLHGEVQIQLDQLPFEPTAATYVRRFLDPTDPSCFPSGDCSPLFTENEAQRTNPLYTVDLFFPKHFRWVAVTSGAEDTGRRAFVARSWIPELAVAADGHTEVRQSFTLAVWLGAADGGTWRLDNLYSETSLQEGVDHGFIEATIRDSMNDVFVAADEGIDEVLLGS